MHVLHGAHHGHATFHMVIHSVERLLGLIQCRTHLGSIVRLFGGLNVCPGFFAFLHHGLHVVVTVLHHAAHSLVMLLHLGMLAVLGFHACLLSSTARLLRGNRVADQAEECECGDCS